MRAKASARLLLIALGGTLLLSGVGAGIALQPNEPPRVTIDALPNRMPQVQNVSAVRKAAELSDAFITIAETVTPAVVRIQSERMQLPPRAGWLPSPLRDFIEPRDSLAAAVPDISGGTGFIVSADGYILTNDHVVENATHVSVALADKRVYNARLVGRDPTTDLAVIKIDAKNLPVVQLGDSDEARVGEWVMAIGNPAFDDASALDFTVTSGIISAKGRPLNIINADDAAQSDDGFRYAIEDFIQTDAVINPGNSGGPLMDLKGSVIGINTAIATSTGYSQGYGFAIPVNLAKRVMKDLIEKGHVERALLGVSIIDVTPEDAEVYGLSSIAGVLIEDFAGDSPALTSGLNRGDVIVAVNGQPATRVGQLQRLVANHSPGDEVTLSVIRYGKPVDAKVRLTQAPVPEMPAAPRPRTVTRESLGIEVADLEADLARQLGFSGSGGAVIIDVLPASAADRKRISPGHRIVSVDQKPIANARQARAALRVASGAIISLLLESPDGRTYIANVRNP